MAKIGMRVAYFLFALLLLISLLSIFVGKLLESPVVTFISNGHGNRDIFLYDIRTQFLHNFTNSSTADEWSYTWSREGERMMYVVPSGVGDDFFVMDANGGGQQQVNVQTQQAFNITWSPTAQHLAYFSSYQNTSELYLISLIDNTTSNLTNTPDISEELPEWSPDGKFLLFRMEDNLHLRDMQTGISQQLTNTRIAEEYPLWSPDGSRIVFQRREELTGKQQLFMLTLANGEEKLLDNIIAPRSQPVSWSPDSTAFVVALDSQQIVIFDIETAALHMITDGSQRASSPVWSPDGRYIAYIADKQLQIYDLQTRQIIASHFDSLLQIHLPLTWLP